MARARRRQRGRQQQPRGWLWLLSGFSLGLLVALGVYVFTLSGEPSANSSSAARADVRSPAPAARQPDIQPPATDDDEVAAAEVPAQTDAANAISATELEFYDLLPEFEVVIPESELARRDEPAARTGTRSANYVVQAGSFTAFADADRMQAKIALLGIESNIQRAEVNNTIYHRVRIGPVTDLGELNRIRQTLREERIEYRVLESQQ